MMWRTARATSFVGGVSAHQIFTCKSDFHLANEFDCVCELMGVAQKIKNLYENEDGAIVLFSSTGNISYHLQN